MVDKNHPSYGRVQSHKTKLAMSRGHVGMQTNGGGRPGVSPLTKEVKQYLHDGTYIATFPSIAMAAKAAGVNPGAVSFSANQKRVHPDFVWKFTKHKVGMVKGSHQCRKVVQYKGKRKIAVYSSLTEAAAAVHVTKSSICYALRKAGTAAGFTWKYLEGKE